jgi:YbbR domain-containing protein
MLDRLVVRWPLKLLAVLLAFLVWLAVTRQHMIPQVYDVPLGVELGENLILTGELPNRVAVRLRGPEGLMRRVDAVGLEVRIDVGEGVGDRNVLLQPENVFGVPNGVDVEFIEPDRLTLSVAHKTSKRVPVEPVFLGEPAEGFAVYGSRIIPDALVVVGPQDQVEEFERLRTDEIRLDGRTSSFSQRVVAIPENPEVGILNPRDLEVTVEIDEAPVEAGFEGVRVVLTGQVYEAEINPSAVKITLSGPPSLLRRVQPENLRAVVDVSDLEPRSRAYKVRTELEFVDLTSRDAMRLKEKSRRREVSVRILDRRLSE